MKAEALEIVKRLSRAGFKAYWAGGCVRDLLMAIEPHDYDIATNARPDQVTKLFDKTVQVGASFGVIKVLYGKFTFEVAAFRSDGKYLDGRHPEKVHFSDEKEDALRRDFTINGMFYDPIHGTIIDYVNGKKDIKSGIIRTINFPEDRFLEDRLRLIRAVRFAARFRFTIESSTYQAIKKMADIFNIVSVERITEELKKMLTGRHPAESIRLLEETGLLKVILPEVAATIGVEQPKKFHPEGDVWTHTLLLLEKMNNPSFELAMAALLHDIGKPLTFSIKDRIRFDNHCEVGARISAEIGKRLRFSKKQIDHIVELVHNHLRFIDVRKMRESTLRRFLRLPGFADHLELHRLDCLASHNDLTNWEFCKQKLSELKPREIKPKPILNGHDLIRMGYKAGPIFKQILTNIEDAHMEGQIKNRDDALRFVKRKFPIMVMFILLFTPFLTRANEANEPYSHKKEEREEVKFRPFSVANRLLLVSGIDINPDIGFGDFKIKNNTNRHITLIFGKVYRYEEENGRRRNIILINNPNKAAILLSNTRHAPGKEAVWRFSLYKSRLISDSRYKYTIDINSRSIFFE